MARKFNVDRALVLYQQHEIMRFGVIIIIIIIIIIVIIIIVIIIIIIVIIIIIIVIIEYFSQPYGLLLCSSFSVEYQQHEMTKCINNDHH